VVIRVRDPDPYRDTGKTCLGGGMHCPSASRWYWLVFVLIVHSRTLTVPRDQAVEQMRRSDGPTSVIIDVPRLEFDVINLLLSNDLLQARCSSLLCYWLELQDVHDYL